MLSLGIDTEEIERFIEWTQYSNDRLLRIFSKEEIAYCREEPVKTAERMAARFAAKEAFYKAVSRLLKDPLTFMRVGPLCSVVKEDNGRPELEVAWKHLDLPPLMAHISLTHTATLATAIVIIEADKN